MMKEASSSSSDLNPENRLLQREFYDNPLAVPKVSWICFLNEKIFDISRRKIRYQHATAMF